MFVLPALWFVSTAAAADVDCDGYDDIVAHGVNSDGMPVATVFLGGPPLNALTSPEPVDVDACLPVDSPLVEWLLAHPQAVVLEPTVAFADLDMDGFRDIIRTSPAEGGVTLLYGSADGYSPTDVVHLDSAYVVMQVPLPRRLR